jgi:hypothetical protein
MVSYNTCKYAIAEDDTKYELAKSFLDRAEVVDPKNSKIPNAIAMLNYAKDAVTKARAPSSSAPPTPPQPASPVK